MSDFRTKLLVVAAMGMAMAGVSYGQTISCGTATGVGLVTTSFAGFTPNPTLRIEGATELVADIGDNGTSALTGWCTTSTATTLVGGAIVNLSLPVTSRADPAAAAPFPGATEATIIVNDCSAVVAGACAGALGSVATQGSVAGGTITFSVVTFPATFNFRITNVRVNASIGTAGSEVTEAVDLETNTPSGVANNPVFGANTAQVGLIEPSLVVTNIYTPGAGNPGSTLAAPPANQLSPPASFVTSNYMACLGNPVSTSASGNIVSPTLTNGSNLSFTVLVKEVASGAFKTQAQENGPFAGVGGAGVANSADVINISLTNIPTSATVYVPSTLNNVGGVGVTTLTLVGDFAATTPPAIANAAVGALVAFTPTSTGTLSIPYTVTAAAAGGAESFYIPVYVTFAKGVAAPQGAITVLTAYGPSAALTGPATIIPTFAPTTATPLSAESILACLTTLVYPFVTNSGSFETGIAIANTTTDNLGPAGASVSVATPGNCTLNFYGNTAQPKSVLFPPTGVLGVYTASPAQNPTYADTLSDLIGAGTNFTGYAIALCNFNEAHGFAFITDYGNSTSGYAEGYLAVVVPNTRNEGLGTGH